MAENDRDPQPIVPNRVPTFLFPPRFKAKLKPNILYFSEARDPGYLASPVSPGVKLRPLYKLSYKKKCRPTEYFVYLNPLQKMSNTKLHVIE